MAAKKVSLPQVTPRPSIDAAREKLGGTAQGHALPPGLAPGVVVSFAGGSGVVLFASIVEAHVLLAPSRMRRFAPAELAVVEGAHGFEELAADARIFGLLREGQPVRYAGEGGLVDGVVVEKCRWGALVERPDGAVVAVGFRKLWPAPDGAAQ